MIPNIIQNEKLQEVSHSLQVNKLSNNLKHMEALFYPLNEECYELKDYILACKFYIQERCKEYAALVKDISFKGESREIYKKLADLVTIQGFLKEDIQDYEEQIRQLKDTVQSQLSGCQESQEQYKQIKLNLNSIITEIEIKHQKQIDVLQERNQIAQEKLEQKIKELQQEIKIEQESNNQRKQTIDSLQQTIDTNIALAKQEQTERKNDYTALEVRSKMLQDRLNQKILQQQEEFQDKCEQLHLQWQIKFEMLTDDYNNLKQTLNQTIEDQKQIIQNLQQNIDQLQIDKIALQQDQILKKEYFATQQINNEQEISELQKQNDSLKEKCINLEQISNLLKYEINKCQIQIKEYDLKMVKEKQQFNDLKIKHNHVIKDLQTAKQYQIDIKVKINNVFKTLEIQNKTVDEFALVDELLKIIKDNQDIQSDQFQKIKELKNEIDFIQADWYKKYTYCKMQNDKQESSVSQLQVKITELHDQITQNLDTIQILREQKQEKQQLIQELELKIQIIQKLYDDLIQLQQQQQQQQQEQQQQEQEQQQTNSLQFQSQLTNSINQSELSSEQQIEPNDNSMKKQSSINEKSDSKSFFNLNITSNVKKHIKQSISLAQSENNQEEIKSVFIKKNKRNTSKTPVPGQARSKSQQKQCAMVQSHVIRSKIIKTQKLNTQDYSYDQKHNEYQDIVELNLVDDNAFSDQEQNKEQNENKFAKQENSRKPLLSSIIKPKKFCFKEQNYRDNSQKTNLYFEESKTTFMTNKGKSQNSKFIQTDQSFYQNEKNQNFHQQEAQSEKPVYSTQAGFTNEIKHYEETIQQKEEKIQELNYILEYFKSNYKKIVPVCNQYMQTLEKFPQQQQQQQYQQQQQQQQQYQNFYPNPNEILTSELNSISKSSMKKSISKLDATSPQMIKVSQQYQDLQLQLEQKQELLEQYQKEISSQQGSIDNFTLQTNILKQQLMETKNMLKDYEIQNQKLQQDMKLIKNANQKLEDKLKVVQIDNPKNKEIIKDLIIEINEYKQKLEQYQTSANKANVVIKYLNMELENYKSNLNIFSRSSTPKRKIIGEYQTMKSPICDEKQTIPISQTATITISKLPQIEEVPIQQKSSRHTNSVNRKRNHSLYTNPLENYDIVNNAAKFVRSIQDYKQ